MMTPKGEEERERRRQACHLPAVGPSQAGKLDQALTQRCQLPEHRGPS